MILSVVLALFACTRAALASPVAERSISSTLLDDFVRYTKYSSGAYQLVCPSPLGNTLVLQFSNADTNTQGFIARDDTRQEIVVAFRGSFQLQDFDTDIKIILIPYASPGVTGTAGARAHMGFLTSYNSVAALVLSTAAAQLAAHPGYALVATGHSLGGALASLGALSLKANFPQAAVLLYSFGQPRTGNAAYAALVDSVVGRANSFRAVHTIDGVPTIIPQILGYQHHGTEYWNFLDPATPDTVKQCAGDEDPTCSDAIPSTGINAAHPFYFNQAIALDPTVCV